MLDSIVIILMVTGLFFFFGATVGLLRFPDFYSQVHAAGKGDTLSSALLLIGLALYNLHHLTLAAVLVSIKILFISFAIFITSPTATHAIMDAGYRTNVKHWFKRKARTEPYHGIERRKGENK